VLNWAPAQTSLAHSRRQIAEHIESRLLNVRGKDIARNRNRRTFERLLDASIINSYSADGWTPLHLAAFFGHPKITEMLLAQDADVTARSRNPNGNTPLHAALVGNHKLVVGLLIGRGADVNAADANGWRPLHLAAANNNLDAINALIAQGADVTAGNGEGLTPLSIAQEKNHREASALLRKYGA